MWLLSRSQELNSSHTLRNTDYVSRSSDTVLEIPFSNSLIIHQEKTKKITTVTVVWICDPNYHKILPTLALNFSKNYWSFERPYQTLESVFHQISKHLEVALKKLGCASFFQPTSQCLDIWWNILPRVWYITFSAVFYTVSVWGKIFLPCDTDHFGTNLWADWLVLKWIVLLSSSHEQATECMNTKLWWKLLSRVGKTQAVHL